MAMRTFGLISPKWSATTATEDILLGSAELQEIKTTRTRKAQEGVEGPNNALLGFSSSSSDSDVSNDSNCSKSCMETVKLLKSQNDQLLRDLEKSSLMVLGYKTGLESVEEKLEFYKKNEFVYVENINGLKWDIQVGEITIRELRKKLEKFKKKKIAFNLMVIVGIKRLHYDLKVTDAKKDYFQTFENDQTWLLSSKGKAAQASCISSLRERLPERRQAS
ncbi:hypothetical protein Tco_0996740 [Tanacetum coccineum]